ncbi:MAG: carboxypeptidase-like regulatory domain-containing protein [Actinomycetota bacterium]
MSSLWRGVYIPNPVTRLGLALACAALVVSQGAPASGAPRGTIRGRILNETTGRAGSGVLVTLTGGRGGNLQRETRTDVRGRFRFEDLATGDDLFYALDARYDGGLFAGGAVKLPADTARRPVVEARLRVWRTTTDPSSIVVARDYLFLIPNEEGAGVIESVTVTNSSAAAYIGRGAAVGGSRDGIPAPSLAFPLPAAADIDGVRILDASLDIPQLVPTDLGGFAATVAVPPGETRITFTYPVTGSGGRFDLSRRALYPVLEHSIFTEEPLSLDSDALEAAGGTKLNGEEYRRWSTLEPLDPGDVVQALALAEARWDPALVVGAAALGVALAGLVAAALVRVRRRPPARPALELRPEGAREDLLLAIAELDLRHRDGELSEREWSVQRATLKERLRNASRGGPEPAS